MTDKSKQEKIAEIVSETGASEFSLHVYASMYGKSAMKVNTLFHIVCPNPKIRSLSKEVVRREAAPTANTTVKTKTEDGVVTHIPVKTTKKSDDELRKATVRAREKALHDKIVNVSGSTLVKKSLPNDQKDFRLMFEFLGWGQTDTDFYVFLYYIGPEDKGKDNVELTRHANWHIVPESHLSLFHKRINADYMSYLRQTPLDVKEVVRGSKHIEYDVRYILYKWRNCTKDVIKTHVELVEANKALFGFGESLSTKHHKKRTKDEMDATITGRNLLLQAGDDKQGLSQSGTQLDEKSPKKKKSSSKKAKHSHNATPTQASDASLKPSQQQVKRDYRIPIASCREVLIDEYTSLGHFPLGDNKKVCGNGFKLDHLVTLFNNHVVREERPPTSYAWEPIQFIKAWFLVTDQARLRKQIVQSIIKKYSLQFDYTHYESFQAIVNENVGACDDIKEAHDSFIFSCLLFRLFTSEGVLPDHIEARLNPVK